MKERIRQCFDRGAATYNNAALIQQIAANTLLSRIRHLTPQRVLEIGCGPGLLSADLIALFPHATFTLTDISPQMIEQCKAKLGAHPQVEFLCADSETALFSGHYDLIISSMTLHWLDNIPGALNHWTEKLTPDGTLLFSLLGEQSFCEWKKLCGEKYSVTPVISFPSSQTLQKYLPQLRMDSRLIKQPYLNLYAFLKSLKTLGVQASPLNYKRLNAGRMRSLIRSFQSTFSVSYEILYGEIQKC